MANKHLSKAGKRIIYFVAIFIIFISFVTLFILGLRQNLIYFYIPSQIETSLVGKKIRIGGIVKELRIEGENIFFILTDCEKNIDISYKGLRPNLLSDNMDAVVIGVVNDDLSVKAQKLMVKHDENYQPPELKIEKINKCFTKNNKV